MAVRNCREIGENLQKIISRLIANDNLVNLLYYTDQDPLNQPHLTDNQKSDLIFNKLIKIIPRVGAHEVSTSVVAVRVTRATNMGENGEFKTVDFDIEVFVPMTQWFVKGTNLRPFMILGEIQESLNNKTINGLGKLQGGDFSLSYITDDMICYQQLYSLIAYD